MQAKRRVIDGREVIEVTHEGKPAAVVEFQETKTVVTLERAYTNWSRQIVKAAKEVSTNVGGKSKPVKEVAPAAESDDIVV